MKLFTYKDAKGRLSRRNLINIRDDGEYLHGYCEYSKGIRTFRKSRIVQEFSDKTDPMFLIAPIQEPGKRSSRESAVHKDYTFEVCFTGFVKDLRERLEIQAKAADMLVRKSVTKNLNFLCCGKNAGPKKLVQAEDAGVLLITIDEFDDLVSDGVMPEGWYSVHPPYVVKPATDKNNVVIDPELYFASWLWKPRKALWSAVGVNQAKQLKEGKQQLVYTLDPNALELQTGDLFYLKDDETEGLQVIDNGDPLEVMHFTRVPEWHAIGYQLMPRQLVDWIKEGKVPSVSNQISKGQSKSEIAKYYEYS